MKKWTRIFVGIVFVCCSLSVKAQDQPVIDSLFQLLRTAKQDTNKVNLLYEVSREFFSNDLDRALKYSNRALFLSEKLDYKKGIALSYNNLGIIHYYKAIYSQALNYHGKSLVLMEELGDQQGMARSYNNIGAIHIDQGNYAKALEVYLNSLRILEEIDDKKGIAGAYNNIGAVYYYQENYPQAMQYYEKSMALHKELGDESGVAHALNNIGIIHFEQGDYQEALEFHFQSLDMREEKGDLRGIAGSYTNIGDVYAEEDGFEKALEYQQKALAIQEEIGDKMGMLSSLKGIGNIYSIQGKRKESVHHLARAVNLAEDIGARGELKSAYEVISEAYANMKDYENAYLYKEKHTAMLDTLHSLEAKETAANLEAKYESEKKQKEIELLKKTNEIQVLQLKKNQTLIWSFSGCLVLVIIVAFIVGGTLRERQKAYSLLSTQNESIKKQKDEKDLLLKEIHHRVKNNLQVINSLIRLQSNHIEDAQALELFDECQNRIISMALIHEKMYESDDLAAINIKEYINHLTRNLISTYRLRQTITMDVKVNVERLGIDTLIPLGLLLNELISNSLKHAFKDRESGNIVVHLDKIADKSYRLVVGDDGVGMPPSVMIERANTLGMELVHILVSQLEGTIFRDENKEGTVFTINFEGLEKENTEIKHLVAETA